MLPQYSSKANPRVWLLWRDVHTRLSPIVTARHRLLRAERRTVTHSVFVIAGRRADVVEDAVRTVGFAGLADPASVEDEQVGEDGPVLPGHHRRKVPLYLLA